MDHKDHKSPEATYGSEFTAWTCFVWSAEACTFGGKMSLEKW